MSTEAVTIAPACADLLDAVRTLIMDPVHWTRHALARDAKGRPCLPNDERATAWDLVGAYLRVCLTSATATDPLWRTASTVGLRVMRAVAEPETLETVNDLHGHAAVLEVVDEALAELDRPSPEVMEMDCKAALAVHDWRCRLCVQQGLSDEPAGDREQLGLADARVRLGQGCTDDEGRLFDRQ